jgi:hypothetical protein
MNHFNLRKTIRSTSGTLLFMLVFMCQFLHLSAQNEIPDSLVKVRIQHIQQMLNEGKPDANLWWYGWLYGYSVATLGQGAVLLTSDNLKTRQDMALGAVNTLIGVAGQLFMPMTSGYAPKRLALIPGDTPEERIIKLNKAEALFEASARREQVGRSWKMHATTGAVNLSSGLITWLGFDRTFKAGLINFAINTAITEAQIWTQPTRAIRDFKAYCEKYKCGLPYASYKPKPRLFLHAYAGGLALRMVF